jgi:hypothetical protein
LLLLFLKVYCQPEMLPNAVNARPISAHLQGNAAFFMSILIAGFVSLIKEVPKASGD